jgi:hypothetical protein
MSKLAPKKYGNKVQVGGDPENSIKQITRIERVIITGPPGSALEAENRGKAGS